MQEEAPVQEVWDLKKIILGLVIIVALAAFLYLAKDMLQKNFFSAKQSLEQVEGASTQRSVDLPSSTSQLRDDAEEKLDAIKKEIESLNAIDIASSSPQVKKIIKDLQDLQNYPSTQIKDLCQNMCKSL